MRIAGTATQEAVHMTAELKELLTAHIDALLAMGYTREDILKELGMNDVQAEMVRAVSENTVPIDSNEYDKYIGF
jgi:hypothetical protein